MANINLLPWRENLRKKKQKNYIVTLSFAAFLACLVVGAIYFVFDWKISNQQSRNDYLRKEMLIVDAEIREINRLKDKKAAMIERVNLVRSLQNTRSVVVHLFDEIARAIPDDLYLTGLDYKQGKIKMTGLAKDNQLISALIRQLDASDWLKNPNLNKIQALNSGQNQFEISISLERPKPEGDK